ncbi:MAG: ABC transporter ATP-binding protein [Clostridia bacterium]|nr:ABC transporter ATP-binding protein [Clostridia bacterium]
MNELLICKDLTKNYSYVRALNQVNLCLEKGKIIGLLGPNGSGKTTLIKTIAGLLKADFGEVLIDGEKVGEKTKAFVSYLPERNYLDDTMKVYETIDLFSDFYSDFDKDIACKMLQNLDIDTNRKFKNLSKGMKEKVQLVLVMSRKARLYLLDEPIGGVDPATRDYILNTIVSNYAPDSTVIISTHLIADVEKVLDEFIFIKNGEIVMQSSVDNLREEKGMSVDEYFREVFKC